MLLFRDLTFGLLYQAHIAIVYDQNQWVALRVYELARNLENRTDQYTR